MKPTTLSSLVLATDGSADAALARRAVADLARATGAAVHVVNAWNLHAMASGYGYVLSEELPALYEEGARAVAASECALLLADGVRAATAHVGCGRPSDVILDLAGTVGADLIVLGSRGHGPVARLALGSVSDAVVRESTRPVLVLRGGESAWPPERIVVGHDGSAESDAATLVAAAVARSSGAPLTLLEIVPGLSEGDIAAVGQHTADEFVADCLSHLEGTARPLGEHLAGEVQARVEIGHPAAMLLAAAAGPHPGMLAVGRSGIGGVRRMLMGSVSTKVLHAAPGAVLVAPAPDPDPAGS